MLSGVDAIYWINLDRSKLRRRNMETLFEDGLFSELKGKNAIKRVEAIDGSGDVEAEVRERLSRYMRSLPSTAEREARGIHVTYKEIACTLSHLTAIKRFAEEGRPGQFAIIMEDDVTLDFQKYWHCLPFENMREMMAMCPDSKWEILQLSYTIWNKAEFFENTDLFVRNDGTISSTVAYLLSHATAKSICEKLCVSGRISLFDSSYHNLTADGLIFKLKCTYTLKYCLFVYSMDNDSEIHSDHIKFHQLNYKNAEDTFRNLCHSASSNGMLHGVDAIYWINLDRSKGRRRNMETLFENELFSELKGKNAIKRVEAIDGSGDVEAEVRERLSRYMRSLPSTAEREARGIHITYKEIACTLSHLTAIKRFAEEGRPGQFAIIMEDDVTLDFQKYWHCLPFKNMREMMAMCPDPKWEILQLSYIIWNNTSEMKKFWSQDSLFLLNNLYVSSALAYLIPYSIAKRLDHLFFVKNRIALFEHNQTNVTADGMLFHLNKTYLLKMPLFTYSLQNDSSIHNEHLPFHYKSRQFSETNWRIFCVRNQKFCSTSRKTDFSLKDYVPSYINPLTFFFVCIIFSIFYDIYPQKVNAYFLSRTLKILLVALTCLGFALSLVLLSHPQIERFEVKTPDIIPHKVWMTWSDKTLPPKMKENVELIRTQNPEFEVRVFDDEDIRQFLKQNFSPEVVSAYDALIPGAFKADLWRYCVLYVHGGIYMDIKLVPSKKLITFTDKEYFSLDVPGSGDIKKDQKALLPCKHWYRKNSKFITDVWKDKRIGIVTNFIVCKPENPILLETIQQTVRNIRNRDYGYGPLYITGPAVLGECYFKGDFSKIDELELCLGLDNQTVLNRNGEIVFHYYPEYRDEQKQYGKHQNYREMWKNRQVFKN